MRASIPEPWTLSLERSGGAADPTTGEMVTERHAVRVGASGPRWRYGDSGWRPLEGDLSALEDAVRAVEWSELVDGRNQERATVGGTRSRWRFERPSGAIEVVRNEPPPELQRIERELIRVVEEAHAAWEGASPLSSSQPSSSQPSARPIACADRPGVPPAALSPSDPSQCPHGLASGHENVPESYVTCSEDSDCVKVHQEYCCSTVWFALRADRPCYEPRHQICDMECRGIVNEPSDGPRLRAACVDSVCQLVP